MNCSGLSRIRDAMRTQDTTLAGLDKQVMRWTNGGASTMKKSQRLLQLK